MTIASTNRQPELIALRELSARVARNPLLVQASSGNISIKIDDVLWIKASGKWMIDADADDFLVEVGLARAKRCLQTDAIIPETGPDAPAGGGASIETAMHTVLPQRVVLHVHSVNTIAWAVRADGRKHLKMRLAGLHWQWIPYTPSGTALAKRIEEILSRFPETDVLVLGNHGLVVCGDCCRSAEQLLADVEERLVIQPRPAPKSDLAQLARSLPGTDWFVPPWAEIHGLATDQISRRILSGGVLYPCQAIFLHGTVTNSAPSPPQRERGARQTVYLLENLGVLCNKQLNPAQQQILLGLANVVQRLDPLARLRYLTASEVNDVLDGPVENYRRVADMNRHSA